MKHIFYISIFISILNISTINSLNAQDAKCRIFAKSAIINNHKAILIKWFFKDIYLKDGVNIYRKDSSELNWVKLNDAPLKIGSYVPKEYFSNDPALKSIADIIIKSPKENIKGILLLTVIIKAIQNNQFAGFLGTFFSDTLARPGKSYQYKITSLAGLKESDLIISKKISLEEMYNVLPPSNIHISPGDESVSMVWEPEEERYFGVNIYRSSTMDPKMIKLNQLPIITSKGYDKKGQLNYPDVFFKDKNLVNDSIYTYTLRVIDFFGDEGTESQKFNVIPSNMAPPKSPEKITVSAVKSGIKLKWEYPYDKEQIIGFKIYRGEHSDTLTCITPEMLSVGTREFNDPINIPGGYYYCISSVNRKNIEGKSNKTFTEFRDYTPPSKPSEVKISSDTGKFIITWNPNTEPDLLGYLVLRKPVDAKYKEYSQITPDAIKVCIFTDKMPRNVTNSFTYKIVAIDTSLNRSEPSEEVVAKMPDVTPPAKPYIKNITDSPEGVLIEWVPNVEPDLSRYEIYRKQANEPITNQIKLNDKEIRPPDNRFKDMSLKIDIEYSYSLVAFDSSGNRSKFSDPYVFTKKSKEQIAAGANNIKLKYDPKNKSVSIKWEIQKKEDFLGSVIYRKKSKYEGFKAITGLLKETSYEDTLPGENTEYFFQLRVYYKSGEQWKSEIYNIKTIKIND